MHYARLLDLVKLQEIRNGYCRNSSGELIEDSQREFMCFLYRYWSCCYTKDSEKALEDALSFNQGFTLPLRKNDVERATVSAEKAYEEWIKESPNGVYKRGGYNYKNVTLIERLCITQEEMEQLATIINNKEVKRRNNINKKIKQKLKYRGEDGLTKRQREKEERIQEVLRLREQGLTQTVIARELKITQQSVSKILKECKNKTYN